MILFNIKLVNVVSSRDIFVYRSLVHPIRFGTPYLLANPVDERTHSRVHRRRIDRTARNESPRHDANQFAILRQRTTGIAAAR